MLREGKTPIIIRQLYLNGRHEVAITEASDINYYTFEQEKGE